MDFGKALRICRALRGLQQDEVAKRANLSTSYVSLIESGRRTPSIHAIRKLSAALRIPESLFSLLATDLSHLPMADAKTTEQLARSLLILFAEASSETDRRVGQGHHVHSRQRRRRAAGS
jgi:transcriptional regulator with XRE-family HTH domain